MKSRLSAPGKALALLAAAALLSACGTTRLPEDKSASAAAAAAAPVVTATPSVTPSAQPAATPQSGVATVNLGGAAAGSAAAGAAALAALPAQRIVFFDFDSYVIKDDFKPLLDGYARVLTANNGKKLMVEGHTDERGGREYNLALGQKRAAAVVNSLRLLGVPESQMEAVSFGEERPAAQGTDESAWAKNRRAELKDR
jgi:peptidoglycan-associated lipoprotein